MRPLKRSFIPLLTEFGSDEEETKAVLRKLLSVDSLEAPIVKLPRWLVEIIAEYTYGKQNWKKKDSQVIRVQALRGYSNQRILT